MNKEKIRINKEEIKQFLPHREPFLFVDEIIEVTPGNSAIGLKRFKEDEEIFRGHFPNFPIVPGVILVEMCAQVSAFILLTVDKFRNSFGFLVGVDDFKFIKKVGPGDTVKVIANMVNVKFGIAKSYVEAFVNDNLVAKGTISIKIVE
ncbi:3-hydroxyacyl-ACP dehydratase FabZ [Caldisericum exile]|uniref:Beta-hydroxyacyl-[acyl-carrier-protein] dehydratase FabZ n=1 Tax=Caldisericum exile (strain DSM 21853 / NBRC 104410 / AZM16c01) TaxID=511051 RepID=A0A7U6GEJ8_CALEA|nr:3-hydroxyacyl-ACP dehydratase FabZ [Caldisericum exile]BAL80921.1 beta-hydroxyacyl-[acyl-carrier-protein] dehydratase FabZ [Caldisericum exile AZM16c01]